MLDSLFSFVGSFIDPIEEIVFGGTVPAEVFFDFIAKVSTDKTINMPQEAKIIEEGKIEVPIDVMMSLLRPDELEKLRNYAMAYSKKYMSGAG